MSLRARSSIAYCIDARFSMPLAVSLRSVLEHWNPERSLDAFVLESGVTDADKRRVEQSLPALPDFRLRWIAAAPGELSGLSAGLHFSNANFFRLLLPRALPEVDHALYLDADTIARADLSALLDLFDQGHDLQACQDYTGTISNPLIRLPNHADFGLAADDVYFNSGVMLMNLRSWRERRIAEEIRELGRAHPDTTFFADQTPINIVLKGRIHRLAPEWNAQTIHPNVVSRAWDVPFVPQDLANAKIVHYTSEYKPWGLGKDLPQAALFREVLSRTAWAL